MPVLIPVDDPDDARLEPYRDIRERDLVGRKGLFVAEGKVVLASLLRSRRFPVDSLLLLENRVDGVAGLLGDAPADLPVYVASAPVIDRVAGFPVHRGVLAMGRRPPDIDAAKLLESLPADATVLVLGGIANHDNLGAIFRNAAAFEADAVLLDDRCCDPLYRKSIRVSVGAALTVPFIRVGPLGSIPGLLGAHRFRQLALSPRGACDIASISPGGRNALYLGTEGEGLPENLMGQIETVRIAMSGAFDSLNVAAASAIALHRLWQGNEAR